jgi:GT2 family glycosyltransferase
MATKGTNAVLRGDYVPTCRHFHTGNNCISVALFREAGGFDETYKRLEDDEFGLRLDELGCKLHFVPAALAWHYPDRSLEAWLKVPRAYAFYTVMLDRRYPDYGYLAGQEYVLRTRNPLLRLARSLLSGHRRTPLAVRLTVGIGCLAHRLRLTPITMAMMSLAWDLNFNDALRETLANPDNAAAR